LRRTQTIPIISYNNSSRVVGPRDQINNIRDKCNRFPSFNPKTISILSSSPLPLSLSLCRETILPPRTFPLLFIPFSDETFAAPHHVQDFPLLFSFRAVERRRSISVRKGARDLPVRIGDSSFLSRVAARRPRCQDGKDLRDRQREREHRFRATLTSTFSQCCTVSDIDSVVILGVITPF